MRPNYSTIPEAINGLKREGYLLDFNIKRDSLVCNLTRTTLSPNDFQIDDVYHFEGDGNSEQAIVYAISSLQIELKGVLVIRNSISEIRATNDLIAKLVNISDSK